MRWILVVVLAVALLGVVAGVRAQDASDLGTRPGTPPAGALCASPVSEATGATPVKTVVASTEGTPIGLFPCGGPPVASPLVARATVG